MKRFFYFLSICCMVMFMASCGGGSNTKVYDPEDLAKIDNADLVINKFHTAPGFASMYEGELTLGGRTGICLEKRNYINTDEAPKEGDCVWVYVKDEKCYLVRLDQSLPLSRSKREARKWCEENIK